MIHNLLDMAILVSDHYKTQLFKKTDRCVEAIISAFEKSSCQARLKCYCLEIFIDALKFTHVERLLNAIEKFITNETSGTYLVTNVNPILTGTRIIHLLFVLSSRYPASEFRAEILIEMMTI